MVEKTIKQSAADVYDLPEGCIEENDKFSSLGDSLDHIEMVRRMEDEFNVQISIKKMEDLPTIGDAIKYVEARLK